MALSDDSVELTVPASISPSGLAAVPVAIVGMAGLFPESATLREFWENVVHGRNCIRDVPSSRWDLADYYDPDPNSPDKTYSRRGGFIPDVPFDPIEWGLPPNTLEVTDVAQLLSLLVAKQALDDAGYGSGGGSAGSVSRRVLDRERTGIILGVGGGQKLITPLTSRLQYPVWERVLVSSGLSPEDARVIAEKIKLAYVPWEENSFPGMLGNVIAGRIANRLDLGGMNCVVDAACAGSLAALRLALAELTDRQADVMITGGVDADNSIFMYMCFSKTPAFSRANQVRPFDAQSDGMMVGEGIGMLVLKRLEDAERDGDRIYAVIRGMGTSSDGRFKSIYAPRSEGQARALRRAYHNADVEPSSIGLIEAHGTGTIAGDLVEATTLDVVFRGAGTPTAHVALGSIKSQMGHTKAAAGSAGLLKTALALHHKVLPPTLNVTEPHPALGLADSPLYLNTVARPWRRPADTPRRAGVSSFGFGGTNFHVVLEEHTAEHSSEYRLHAGAVPLLLAAAQHHTLVERVRALLAALGQEDLSEARRHLREAASQWRNQAIPSEYARLGLVAESPAEARALLEVALTQLETRPDGAWDHPKGISYRQRASETPGTVAALFPGQGSQFVDMGQEIACAFPEVRDAFAAADALFEADSQKPLSEVVYPVPAFTEEARQAQSRELQQTMYAQPAIGALSIALYRLMQRLGFEADVFAGHSFGELTALWAGGALSDEAYLMLAYARGQAMAPPSGDAAFDAGAMLSVKADAARVGAILAADTGLAEVRVANLNSPEQTVIAGPSTAMADAQASLAREGLAAVALPVSAAFHTPLVAHAQAAFADAIAQTDVQAPSTPVYSNASGEPHTPDAAAVRQAMVEHLLRPVQFQREIEHLYENGARIFVEVGPRSVLTNLVNEILGDRPHFAIALNPSRQRESVRQFWEALVRLRVAGLTLDLRDPYLAEDLKAPLTRQSGATVVLNGSNYVSQKTQQAFEDALQDGYRVQSLPGSNSAPTERAAEQIPSDSSRSQAFATPAPPRPERSQSLSQPSLQTPTPAVPSPSELSMSQISDYATTPAVPPAPETLPSMLTLMDRGLTTFGQLQSEALRAHQQYLEQQAEQSRPFVQFMQQQQELLLAQGGLTITREAHETLARSLALYQELQVETMRLHQQFLQQHAEHSRAFVELLRQQTSGAPVPATLAATPVASPPVNQGASIAPAPFTPPAAPSPRAMSAPPAPATSTVPAAPSTRPSVIPTVTHATPATPVATPLTPAVQFQTPPTAPVSYAPAAPHVPPAAPAPSAASSAPPAAPAPHVPQAPLVTSPATSTAESRLTVEEVTEALLKIVSEKTGYPVETLGLDMDIEADLGIDSIKRVEILGAMHARFPDAPVPKPAELAELQTLQEVVEFLGAHGDQAPPSSQIERSGVPAMTSGETVGSAPNVPWTGVRLKQLPLPDALETAPPPGSSCVLTDDGTPLTGALAQVLTDRGWRVAVLRLADMPLTNVQSLPYTVVQASDVTEAALQQALDAITAQAGPVGVFFYIGAPSTGDALFSEAARAGAKQAFLLAKLLNEPLNRAASEGAGRAAFMTVTRVDGALGTGLGQSMPFSAENGGLFGLVKTLKLEWPAVHCRAIDVSPALDHETAAHSAVSEYLDPDGLLAEVGCSASGRVTLVPAEPLGAAR